jgi:hypothetical protein
MDVSESRWLHGDDGCRIQRIGQWEQEGIPGSESLLELLMCELKLVRLCSGQMPIHGDRIHGYSF